MSQIHLVERRQFLTGLGAVAVAGCGFAGSWAVPQAWVGVTAKPLGPLAPHGSKLLWTPAHPWERTDLGSVPRGSPATVYLRGTWGPTVWRSGRAVLGALAVAHPIVQIVSLEGARELRRVSWTGRSISIPAGEASRIFLLSALWDGREAPARTTVSSPSATLEARLAIASTHV